MALSESVEASLREAEASLRNALLMLPAKKNHLLVSTLLI
jgi:hypothetical protein